MTAVKGFAIVTTALLAFRSLTLKHRNVEKGSILSVVNVSSSTVAGVVGNNDVVFFGFQC